MKRRQFTLTIDVEGAAFYEEGIPVTDHTFDRDRDQDDPFICVCGQENQAHDDGVQVGIEVARILRELATSVEQDMARGTLTLTDINGHAVGSARFTEVDVPEEEQHEPWCDGILYARWSGLSCDCGAKREGY